MHRLYSALQLKKLLIQKALGETYTQPLPTLQEKSTALPTSLDKLKELCNNCYLCELSKSRKKVVFGKGNPKSDILFIGEAPGATEDSVGEPFVGRAGELLTKMIENVLNRPRSSVYLSNIVKCRPPNNRAPTPKEALTCRPYIFQEIEIIKPKLIVALGATAFNYLTNDTTPISKARGHFFTHNDIKVIPTFHPSYLLRNPSAKKEAYSDMLKVKNFLAQQ
ncbi:MAG TPA: uracil-DNA glycosylase [Nitratifractor sp.]|nr:uracil-DNA glycosylase [Nitratifractor sp.]